MAGNQFRFQFIISAYDQFTSVINGAVNNATRKFGELDRKIGEVGRKTQDLGRTMMTAGAAMGAGMALPAKNAIDFETAMGGVAKQVDGIRDRIGNIDPGKLAEMSDEVLRLSRVLPLAATDIANMTAAAARMGIAKKDLSDFVSLASRLQAAFDHASPEQLAEEFGKLANVLNVPIAKIGALADTINYLDDQTLAKGPEIIEVMRRTGAAAQMVGMQQNSLAALATTFLSMGTTAEISATGINALFMKLGAANAGSKQLKDGLKMLGLEAKNVQQSMTKDAQGTILRVLDAINKLPKVQRTEVLAKVFGLEYQDDIAKLASGVEQFRKNIQLANSEQAKGSVQREFNARMQETAKQLQIARNRLTELSIRFGTLFLPAINSALAALNPYLDKLNAWVRANPELAKRIGAVTVAISGFLVAGGGILLVVGGVIRVFGSMFGTMALVARGIGAILAAGGRLVAFLRFLFPFFVGGLRMIAAAALANPVGAVLTGIAVAAGVLYANWDKVGPVFRKVWAAATQWLGRILEYVRGLSSRFLEAGRNIVQSIADGIRSGASRALEAISSLTAKMREYLPFSPAKAGAFRDLHRVQIVETIAQSMKPAPLTRAMGAVTAAAVAVASPAPRAMASPAAPGSRGGAVTVNYSPTVNINGASGPQEAFAQQLKKHEREIARIVEQATARAERRSF